jgi:hypothetical protein
VPLTRDGLEKHLLVCVNESVPCDAAVVGCLSQARGCDIGRHYETCYYMQQKPILLRIQQLEATVESLEKRLSESETNRRMEKIISHGISSCVSRFEANGSFLEMCVLKNGHFVVSDFLNRRILILSSKCEIIRSIGSLGSWRRRVLRSSRRLRTS